MVSNGEIISATIFYFELNGMCSRCEDTQYVTLFTVYHSSPFDVFAKQLKLLLLTSLCLSVHFSTYPYVCPHATTQEPLNELLLNLMFWGLINFFFTYSSFG